jgi:two-component sensor histidine kinase
LAPCLPFFESNVVALNGGHAAGRIRARPLCPPYAVLKTVSHRVVADKGRGRTSARRGFGTRMMTALVSQLSGHLDFEDNAPGVRVVLSAPIVHQ